MREIDVARSMMTRVCAALCFLTASSAVSADDVSLARQVIAAAPEISKIWPGYWPPDQPFIFYRKDGRALVFSVDATWGDGVRVEDAGPGLYRADIPNLPRKGSFVINHPIGSHLATGVQIGDSSERDLFVLFHEGFHGFQHSDFDDRIEPPTPSSDFVTDEMFALKGIEMQLLGDALSKAENHDMLTSLGAYLAIRQYREKTQHESVTEAERHFERIEGTAEYVGARAAAVVWNHSEKQMHRRMLAHESALAISRNSRDLFVRWQSYGTGGGLCFVLDRIAENWQPRIAGGKSPVEVVREVYPLTVPTDPEWILAVADGLQYDLRVRNAAKLRKRRVDTERALESFGKKNKFSFVIRGEFISQFETVSTHHLDDGRILIPDVTRYSVDHEKFRLSIRGLWLLHGKWAIDGRKLTVAMPRAPKFKGCQVDAEVVKCPAGTVFSRSGFKLEFKEPLVVRRAADAFEINLN